ALATKQSIVPLARFPSTRVGEAGEGGNTHAHLFLCECQKTTHSLSSSGLTGRSSIPETALFIPEASRILDFPHSPGMTVEKTHLRIPAAYLARVMRNQCPSEKAGGRRECRALNRTRKPRGLNGKERPQVVR